MLTKGKLFADTIGSGGPSNGRRKKVQGAGLQRTGLFFGSILFFALAHPVLAAAPILGHIQIDHFGYRSAAIKTAFFNADPGASFEIHDAGTDALVLTVSTVVDDGVDSASPLITGDHVWHGDFSALVTPGHYVVYSAGLAEQSYDFFISDTRYQAPMQASLKSFFYTRCGAAKPGAQAGIWSDTACHLADAALNPFCGGGNHYGAMSYGPLDLRGGWHDAGDYEKKIGYSVNCGNTATGDNGDALYYLLLAYEMNPGAFYDFQTNIPESGNGVPDILDEAKYELDFYLRMQRPDAHVLAGVHVAAADLGNQSSPPSADAVVRTYLPPAYQSEAVFVASLARAARVMAGVPGLAAYAATLRTAALQTWDSWVKISPDVDPWDLSYMNYKDFKLWAASEVYRLDSSRNEAKAIVDGYTAWSGYSISSLYVGRAMVNYMQSPGATASVSAAMTASLGAYVDHLFSVDDQYHSGMDAWRYSWNSNWWKADFGLTLVLASRLGATGSHTALQCAQHGEEFLHYLHGVNPLNMAYFTNAASLGAGHGVWHYFNTWFGSYGRPYSKNNFIGKPAAVSDASYPYLSGPDNYGYGDNDVSAYGPPPGFVPGGPTYQYKDLGGTSVPPLQAAGVQAPYDRSYRDFDYVNASSQPWIVNEGGIYETSAYLALVACFSGPPPPSFTPTVSSTQSQTFTVTPAVTATPSASPSSTATQTIVASATITSTPPPSYCPLKLVDDFEDPSRNGVDPQRTCLLGGSWNTNVSAATCSAVYSGAGAVGIHGAAISGTLSTTSAYASWYANFTFPSTPLDAAAAGASGVQFYMQGDGKTYRFAILNSGVTDFDHYGIDLTPPVGSWTLYQIPFSSLARAGWGSQTGLPLHPSGSDVTGVQFTTPGGASGAYAYGVDQLAFYCTIPTPTASPSLTPSHSPSSSPTPTFGPAASPTLTPVLGGPLILDAVVPIPHPDPLALALLLQGSCEGLRLRLYSQAMAKVLELKGGAQPAGWCRWQLPQDWDAGVAPGLYFAVVTAFRGAESSPSRTIKMVLLR